MGQKVNPHGMRVGVNKDWSSKWYADKTNFADLLVEDNQIRAFVKKKLYNAGVSNTVIERKGADEVKVIVMCARPGMVIGRSGEGIDEFKKALVKMTGKKVDVSIEEVRRTELDAQLTAESVAQSLERRTSFRRAMKQPIGRTMKAGAKGIKIVCSGRLGGAEIARSEKYSEGNVPLHTLAEERKDKKGRRNDRKDRRAAGREGRRDGRRFDGREAKPEVKPATTRVRKAPKAAPAPAAEPQAEAAQETEA